MSASTTPARRRKGGRPTKYTPKTVNTLCEHVREGVPFVYCAALADISLSSFFEWQNRFPRFRERILMARAQGVETRLKIIRKAMDTGNHQAAQWWLEHVESDYFSKSKLEVTGPNGSPLAMAVAIYLPKKDDPETKALPAITTNPLIENETV